MAFTIGEVKYLAGFFRIQTICWKLIRQEGGLKMGRISHVNDTVQFHRAVSMDGNGNFCDSEVF